MTNSINNNNNNSKEAFGKASDYTSSLGTAAQWGYFAFKNAPKLLGGMAKNLPLVSIGFEVKEDGIGKGLFSGTTSSAAGILGASAGFIVGARIGGVPGAGIGAVAGNYLASTQADKWADNYYAKNLKKPLDETYNNINEIFRNNLNSKQLQIPPHQQMGVFKGQKLSNLKTSTPVFHTKVVQNNNQHKRNDTGTSLTDHSTPALGSELKKANPYKEITLQTDEPSFLEKFGFEDMHKQNGHLYNFAGGASLTAQNISPQDNTSGQSFLESLGLPDMQKQYAHLSTFGGFGLNLNDVSRNAFPTKLGSELSNAMTSNTISFHDYAVNSSDTYATGISQSSVGGNDPTKYYDLGPIVFAFNPYTLIVVAVGFIVSWLNKLFCGD